MVYILLLIIIALLVYHINFSPTRKKERNEENLRKTLDYLKSDMFDQDNENVKQTIKNIEDSRLGLLGEQSPVKMEKEIEEIRED